MEATRLVLDILLALLLLATGGGKLAGAGSSHAIRDSLHVPGRRWRLIGALEVLGVIGLVIGLWMPVAATAAAIGVAALMIGAVITRLGAGQGRSAGVVADVLIGAGALVAALLNAQAI